MQPEREKLVNDNIRLVYFMYEKLRKTPFVERNKDDIISEGLLGLTKAANRYDFNKGTKFASFASICIRNEMLMFIRKNEKSYMHEVSLNTPIGYDEKQEITLQDILPSEETLEESVIAKLMIEDYIKKQPDKDQKILRMSLQGKTKKEIASEMGCCYRTVKKRFDKIKKSDIFQ